MSAIFVADRHLFLGLGLAACTVLSIVVHSHVKCPRCGLHVWGKDGFRKFGEVPSELCERCGRSRKGVWPFQYSAAPEGG